MQTIREKQLYKLLQIDRAEVTLQGKGGELSIGQRLNLRFSADMKEQNISYDGFNVEQDGKMRVCKTYNSLVQYLKKIGQEGEFCLLFINGSFPTVEKYEKWVEFSSLKMKGLLAKYLPIADRMVLVCPLNGEKVSPRQAEIALQEERERQINHLKAQYEKLQDKEGLPPFDRLIGEVEEECEQWAIECEKSGEFYAPCDRVSEEKTKYFTPNDFCWQLYQTFGTLHNQKKYAAYDVGESEATAKILQNDKYLLLRDSLLGIKPTFSWHCTGTVNLNLQLTFALNEKTEAYLRQFESDYDLEELQDLAFYKGDTLLFSSCTHEGFHSDLSEE